MIPGMVTPSDKNAHQGPPGRIRMAVGIPVFSRQRGGAERYVVDLCRRMAEEGCEVHVFAEQWDEIEAPIVFHPVRTIPFPKSARLLLFALRATRGIEDGAYDIAFGVGNTLKATLLQPHGGVHWAWFWRSLRAYGHPVHWTLKFLGRVLSPKQWAGGWIENAPYRMKHLPCFVAISEMVKQDMMQWYGIPDERIAVVYNGVDIERFHPRNQRFRSEIRRRHGIGEEPLILFVSNNFRMKGLGILVRALAEMKQENGTAASLLVLGRDRSASYLRMARNLGIREEVVFAGSTEEPEKYYGAADLLVHPTFYDACSLTVLEALASGLPVITSASNGASGIMNHGVEGFILGDPRDHRVLKGYLSALIEPEARQRASRAARRLAEDHSIESNHREMRALLERQALRKETRE